MSFIPATEAESLRRYLAAELAGPVVIDYYTAPHDKEAAGRREAGVSDEDGRALLEELAALSDRLTLGVHDAGSFEGGPLPAIVLRGAARGQLRFFGIPTGLEFAALLSALGAVSRGDSGLSPPTRDALRDLDRRVHIQVFVTPTCPFCPRAALIALQMAVESARITADVIDAAGFPELVERYEVQGVPKVIVNETTRFVGAQPEARFLALLSRSGMKARFLRCMMASGRRSVGRAALRFVAGVAAVAAPAGAQAGRLPLSLAEALDQAARQNPEVLALRAHAQAEGARAASARRASWPRLALSTGWSRTNTASTVFAQKLNAGAFTPEDFAIAHLNDPSPLSHLTTTLALEAPVDVFGGLHAGAEAQSTLERAALATTDESSQELRLRVVQAYWRAALAERTVDSARRALAGARQREADVEARVAEGASLRADLLRARARRRQRDAELAQRQGEVQSSAAALARVLGADAGASYQPTDVPSAPPSLDGDAASWTSRALAARASLRAARERLDGRAWAARAEQRSGRPDLVVWGQVQDDRGGGFSTGHTTGTAGVLLRWAFLDPSRGRRMAAAEAETRATELEARAAADQVRLEVETAWQGALAARERYLAAAGGAEEGREALHVVQERRRQGLATLTDELETESAALLAELEELGAASEAAIADAALRRAAGAL